MCTYNDEISAMSGSISTKETFFSSFCYFAKAFTNGVKEWCTIEILNPIATISALLKKDFSLQKLTLCYFFCNQVEHNSPTTKLLSHLSLIISVT